MAFIEPMHRNKPNITYLLTVMCIMFCDTGQWIVTDQLGVVDVEKADRYQ